MLGRQQLTIAGNQFAAGLCTSDYLGDGGMGVESQNLNPVYQQGAIYSLGTLSSSGLSAHLVATSEEFENPLTHNRWAVDTASNFYYIGSNEVVSNPISGSKGYTLGQSDMAPFDSLTTPASALYITSNTDITRLSGSVSGGLSIGSEAFWTSTKSKTALTSGVPHPVLVYQKILWVGNGNHLPNMTSSGSANDDASWVLDTNEQITALGIDPGTGYMMVGVQSITTGTVSNTAPSRNYIYLYDGYSAQSLRKIPVQGKVYSFTTVGGQIFVGMDNTIGIWNGNGVTFLRRLGSSSIPYKHRCAANNNYFLVADGTQTLCYGDIQNGKKAWFPLYKDTNTIDVVFQQASGIIGSSADGSHVKFVNLFDTNNGAGTGIFYTNNINFERPVFIRGFRIFTTGISSADASSGIGGVSLIDETGATYSPTSNKFVVSSGTRYVFDFPMEKKLQTMQPKITLDTAVFGIVRIVIYYDPAE